MYVRGEQMNMADDKSELNEWIEWENSPHHSERTAPRTLSRQYDEMAEDVTHSSFSSLSLTLLPSQFPFLLSPSRTLSISLSLSFSLPLHFHLSLSLTIILSLSLSLTLFPNYTKRHLQHPLISKAFSD